MNQRKQALKCWLSKTLNMPNIDLQALAGDASFRRYFRLQLDHDSFIAVDSPHDKEPFFPFIQIANIFKNLGLNVPHIFHTDETQGFLLISDFGNKIYCNELNSKNADKLYHMAIHNLLIFQTYATESDVTLASFDQVWMLAELKNFSHWFLEKYLELDLPQDVLHNTFDLLLQNANEQPKVFIHRDYHSKNLMLLPNNELGILDFQDAMIGPLTYDLASLLRDCYIDWPANQVLTWVKSYYQTAIKTKLFHASEQQFLRWFDLMGMQRHLKAIFIFARKQLRDNNDTYLQYIPRTLKYVQTICDQYAELMAFQKLLNAYIIPAWQQKWKTT
ncbi:MAG: phosphotransferase [Pseudomonadota bacterium]